MLPFAYLSIVLILMVGFGVNISYLENLQKMIIGIIMFLIGAPAIFYKSVHYTKKILIVVFSRF